jgi:hypothetical protein
MMFLNTVYYWLHFIFFAPVLISIFLWMKKSTLARESIIFLYFIFAYVVFTCGISFFQGDRFLIAMLPVWIFVYAIVTQEIIRFYKSGTEIV